MLRLERIERGAWLHIDRPAARNALTADLWRELGRMIARVAADASYRVLVIAGNADAFVAGADILDFRGLDSAGGIAYEEVVERTLTALEALDIPTIAAICGVCTGGGTVLASACDIRIATASARIGIPIARTVGNVTTAKNIARVIRVAGRARTLAWFLTAELTEARALQHGGFVLETAADFDALTALAARLAKTLANNAPLTLSAVKELVRRAEVAVGNEDRDLLERCYGSSDFREGVAAFAEKRRARFEGR